MNIVQHLEKLPFWDKLSEQEKDIMSNCAVIQNCTAGELLSGSNTSCLGLTFIISGELRAYLVSEEGREITLFRLAQDEVCILSASCVISEITFDTQITAEKDSQLLVVPSGVFSDLTEENIYVRCFMYEKMTERFSSVMFSMQQILFMRFDSRLASFLISESEHTGSDEINMTHEQIAQHVNSAREVVARMLKRFVADRLIEMKRGSIQIIDSEKLKKLI